METEVPMPFISLAIIFFNVSTYLIKYSTRTEIDFVFCWQFPIWDPLNL